MKEVESFVCLFPLSKALERKERWMDGYNPAIYKRRWHGPLLWDPAYIARHL